jgi:glycerol-3-phosphate dehydrogenase (NAD(P)+)
MNIAVIGAGSWGTALGIHAARANHTVALWTRDGELAATINRERRHPRLSAVYELPDALSATNDFKIALSDASLVLLALPSHATRETWQTLVGCLTRPVIVISATKGIETNTGKRISEIIADESLEMVAGFVALSGSVIRRRSCFQSTHGNRRGKPRRGGA